MEVKKETIKDKDMHKGHRGRLRNTFNHTDVITMPEHQILELMLSFVLPQKDVNPLAHELLNEFGCLTNVLEASPDSLKKIKGVGEVVASFLSFCSKLPEIYKHSKANIKRKLNTPAQIIDFLRGVIEFTSVENFYYICLSTKADVLCFKKMGTGSITQLYVNNRELVQQILKYPTHTIVLCHTHPNGAPVPSEEDIDFTMSLCELFDSLSIRLCDHIILSPDGYFSFFENKLLGSDLKTESFNKLKMNMLFDKGFIYHSTKDNDDKIIKS
ncbi:MAG: hypothetical protein IJW32_03455 [Clostridia bacterium]|nr:hypothetical protein [Clostridia bacterium]